MKRATGIDRVRGFSRLYFNPRPHEEGDPAPERGSAKPKDFNPRPHEEGDPTNDLLVWAIKDFNPRPHEEGDNSIFNFFIFRFSFQSTPS